MDEIGGIFGLAIYLVVLVFYLFVAWRVFEKAGQPGFLGFLAIMVVDYFDVYPTRWVECLYGLWFNFSHGNCG